MFSVWDGNCIGYETRNLVRSDVNYISTYYAYYYICIEVYALMLSKFKVFTFETSLNIATAHGSRYFFYKETRISKNAVQRLYISAAAIKSDS